MSFSLSPAITIQEYNLSLTAPNVASSRTGFAIRSETGEALKIVGVTNEAELIRAFGKPTVDNYNDWYQVWNFLQYSQSAYVVRAMKDTIKNAGAKITGSFVQYDENLGNMYNSDVAEMTLENGGLFDTDKMYVYNRYITTQQNNALTVCSSRANWRAGLSKYFMATVDFESSPETDVPQIDNLDVTVDGVTTSHPLRLSVMPGCSLVPGSQFIDNYGTLYTVKAVVNDTVPGSPLGVYLDRDIAPQNVSKYYGTVVSATSDSITFVDEDFNVTSTTLLTLLTSSGLQADAVKYTVTNIQSVPFGLVTRMVVSIAPEDPLELYDPTQYAADDVIFSNTDLYSLTLDASYIQSGNYVLPAGLRVISVLPGFTYTIDSWITINGGDYFITDVDTDHNTITIRTGLSTVETLSDPTIVKENIADLIITGINMLDNVFDDSLIVEQKVPATVNVNGIDQVMNVVTQSLVGFDKFFDFEPLWNSDQFVIVVLQQNTSGLYQYYDSKLCSYDPAGRDSQGRNIFVDSLFFNTSDAFYIKTGPSDLEKVETANIPLVEIVGDSTTLWSVNSITEADIIAAEDLFADSETFDINILIAHQADINGFSNIAETRKDCVAIVAPWNYQELVTKSASDATQVLINEFGTQTLSPDKLFTRFGTYSAIYGNMKYQYDKFNDLNRWMSVGGDVAGLCAQNDANNDPWWAVAGTTRGIIKNCIKLAVNPRKQNRDDLYVNGINPIMSIPGEGQAVVWGNKTATAEPSAFDRLNVRRLLIVVEKTIATAARFTLFEFNDTFTRNRLKGLIEPYLRTVKSRRGIYDFLVVCDASNNPGTVIDANALVVDIYLKPEKVAEFINVNVFVTRTDANFQELIGRP